MTEPKKLYEEKKKVKVIYKLLAITFKEDMRFEIFFFYKASIEIGKKARSWNFWRSCSDCFRIPTQYLGFVTSKAKDIHRFHAMRFEYFLEKLNATYLIDI